MRIRRGTCVLVLGALLSLSAPARAAAPDDAAFLLGGRVGDARTIALDDRGRTIAQAEGAGSTTAISVCPGSRVFAELVTGVADDHWWKVAVAIRDVRTLALRGEHPFTSFERRPGPNSVAPVDIECLDASGRSVAVLGRDGAGVTIARVAGDEERIVHRSKVRAVELQDGRAFIAQDTALRELDLLTGRIRHVGTISPGTMSLDVAPDRQHVIFSATGDGNVSKAGHFVLDVAARRVERLRTRLTGYSWVDDRSFVVFGRSELVRVFDVGLRKLAQWTGWAESDGVVREGVVYGASTDAVVSAPVRTGPAKTLRLFPLQHSFTIELVPEPLPVPATPAARVRAAGASPPASASGTPAASAAPTSAGVALPHDPSSSRGAGRPTTAAAAFAVLLAAAGGIVLVRGARRAR